MLRPVFLAAILVLSACAVSADAGDTIVRRVADPMPALSGEGLDGAPLSVADYEGQILVVNVWATWCGPCEAEQPELVRVANAYAGRGVAFLGINHADQTAGANEFVRRFDVPYPSLSDPAGRIAASLGYVGLPDTYIVDAGGTIRIAINGPTTEAQLTALLDEVLAAGEASASASAPGA